MLLTGWNSWSRVFNISKKDFRSDKIDSVFNYLTLAISQILVTLVLLMPDNVGMDYDAIS